MKCVILAGGRGTRISEESHLKPKPMIEIGGRPIIWHIMKLYGHHGITDFVICLGHRGYVVKEYFNNYFLHSSDVTIDLLSNSVEYHSSRSEPWRVTLVDTGEATMTGGRLLRARPHLQDDEPFCVTYGDGLASIDLDAEIAFHRAHGDLATMTVVRPPARFGGVRVDGDHVTAFEEKPQASTGLINGGFFVLSTQVLDLVSGDQTVWEGEPLEQLAKAGQLHAWRHDGFWQPMDTMRERQLLELAWERGVAPWKKWT